MSKLVWVVLLVSTLAFPQSIRVPSPAKQFTITGLCNGTTWRAWKSLDGATLYITCARAAQPANTREMK